jgi:hypothetical protein
MYLDFVWTTEVKGFAETHFHVLQAGGRRFEPCHVHQILTYAKWHLSSQSLNKRGQLNRWMRSLRLVERSKLAKAGM